MIASLLALGLLGQTVPLRDTQQLDLVRKAGGSVRVERGSDGRTETWIDFEVPIKNADMRALARIETLTALRLLAGGFDDEGVRHIKDVPRLNLLVLKSDKLTDQSLTFVSALKGIRKLDFIGATLTRSGLIKLGLLPALERLYLYGAKIADRDLDPLKRLKAIKLIHLPSTVSEPKLAELRRALPGVEILCMK